MTLRALTLNWVALAKECLVRKLTTVWSCCGVLAAIYEKQALCFSVAWVQTNFLSNSMFFEYWQKLERTPETKKNKIIATMCLLGGSVEEWLCNRSDRRNQTVHFFYLQVFVTTIFRLISSLLVIASIQMTLISLLRILRLWGLCRWSILHERPCQTL